MLLLAAGGMIPYLSSVGGGHPMPKLNLALCKQLFPTEINVYYYTHEFLRSNFVIRDILNEIMYDL